MHKPMDVGVPVSPGGEEMLAASAAMDERDDDLLDDEDTLTDDDDDTLNLSDDDDDDDADDGASHCDSIFMKLQLKEQIVIFQVTYLRDYHKIPINDYYNYNLSALRI